MAILIVKRTSFISKMSMLAIGFLNGVEFFERFGLATVRALVDMAVVGTNNIVSTGANTLLDTGSLLLSTAWWLVVV